MSDAWLQQRSVLVSIYLIKMKALIRINRDVQWSQFTKKQP